MVTVAAFFLSGLPRVLRHRTGKSNGRRAISLHKLSADTPECPGRKSVLETWHLLNDTFNARDLVEIVVSDQSLVFDQGTEEMGSDGAHGIRSDTGNRFLMP